MDMQGHLLWQDQAKTTPHDLMLRVPHDTLVMGQIFKGLIRNCSEPVVFPNNVYEDIISIGKEEDEAQIMQNIEKLVRTRFETHHRHAGSIIFTFLCRVAASESKTKMGTQSLAVVFSPTLLRSQSNDPMEEMQNMKYAIAVVKCLIENAQVFDK